MITIERDRRRNLWIAWADDLQEEEMGALLDAGFSLERESVHEDPICSGEPIWGELPIPYRVLN